MSDEPEKTPETPAPQEPEKVVEHPEDAGHDASATADLRATVTALADKVASLESTVTSLLPENRDETPTRKPWTHRRFGG